MVTHVKELKKAFLIVVSVDLAIFRRNSVTDSMINVHGADYLNWHGFYTGQFSYILYSTAVLQLMGNLCN